MPKSGLALILAAALVVLGADSVVGRDAAQSKYQPIQDWLEDQSAHRPDARALYESAAADSYCIVWYTFDPMSWQGWTRIDNTIQTGAFFHVDDFSGLGGGDFARLMPIAGMKSMWIGVRPNVADPYLCSWRKAPGYGNGWNQTLITDPLTVAGTVTWSFHAVYDSESDCDITHAQYDAGGGAWTDVASFTGDGDTTVSFFIPITTQKTKLRFHFLSDGEGSDQDGLWNTDGGFIVDDIAVVDQASLSYFEDFEAEEVGQGTAGIWTAQAGAAYGRYSGLKSNLIDKDPRNENLTAQVAFFVGSPFPSATYPGLYDTPFCSGAGSISAPCQDEMIVSPVIDMTKYSLGRNNVQNGTIPAGDLPLLGGTCLQFEVYRDLPFENLVFYQWHVRSIVGGCPGPWLDNGYLYYGAEQVYLSRAIDVSGKIAGNDPVQIAFRVVDMCDAWYGEYGGCAQHTPAPWIDNVRLYRLKASGPRWAYKAVDLFSDDFQRANGFVRADAAIDINPIDDPTCRAGDSIVVDCSSLMGGGIDTMPNGHPAVYLHVMASWIGAGEPPLGPAIHGVQLQGDCGLWSGTDAGGWDIIEGDYARARGDRIEDRFAFDLNDSLFVGGYEIDYYFTAVDVAGMETALPSWARSVGPYFEWACLPTGNSDVLFIDEGSGVGSWGGVVVDSWEPLLDNVQPRVDTYRCSPSLMAMPPGERFYDAFDHNLLPALRTYHTLIWDTGWQGKIMDSHKRSKAGWFLRLIDESEEALNLYGLGTGFDPDDLEMLRLWFKSGVRYIKRSKARFYTEDGTMYIRATYEGIIYENGVPITVYYTLGPLYYADHVPPVYDARASLRSDSPLLSGDIACAGAEIGDVYIDSYGVPYESGETMTWNAALTDTFTGTAKPALEWVLSPPGEDLQYAAIQCVDTNANGAQIKTMFFGFSLVNIGTALPPAPSAPMARIMIAKKVLAWMGVEMNDPFTGTTLPPPAFGLAQNYPNPFNPLTTIKLDLRERGLVRLRIYNVAGQLVRTLLDTVRDAGSYSITWNGRDNRGAAVASGIYFCAMETSGFSATRKMVLLR